MEGDGSAPPAAPNVTFPQVTFPYPNLVVTLLHPDRDAVRVGHALHVYVVAENVGFRYLANATVALYDGVDPALLVGEANVTLTDFRGAADFTWTPTGPGGHAIRAVADPHAYVEETNETDNEASVVVEVTPGPPIGRPDLRVRSTDLTPAAEVVANATSPVNVTVHNVGDAAAASVVVEVWEVERSLRIANYTIGNALPGSEDVRTVSWVPDGEGARHLEVRVDPHGTIAEHNETDNVAPEGFDVRPSGTLSLARPPDVQPWCPRALIAGD